MNSNRKRREPLFQKLDDHFLLHLVHVSNLRFEAPEWSADNLDEVSDAKLLDNWFGDDEAFDGCG